MIGFAQKDYELNKPVWPILINQATLHFKFLIQKKTKNVLTTQNRWRFNELETGQSVFMKMADVSPSQYQGLIAAIRTANKKQGIKLKLYKNKKDSIYEVCRIE